MSVLVKVAGVRLPAVELVLARGLVTLVLSYLWLRGARVPLWGKDKKMLLIRSALGLAALTCFFYAVTRLPLAEVTVIHFLNPILAALIAALVLNERVGLSLVLGLLLSFGGVALVARPQTLFGLSVVGALHSLGLAAALGGAVFSAAAYVTVRKLSQREHPLVIVFYFPLVTVPLMLPAVIPVFVMPSGWEWLQLAGIGVSTQLAQVFLTSGLKLVPTGRGTAVGYLQVVFALLWGLTLFDEVPGLMTLGGAGLVLLGTLVIGLTTRRV